LYLSNYYVFSSLFDSFLAGFCKKRGPNSLEK